MAYQGGKLSDGTPLNVAVYRAYRNAGLSHTQALAVTAEVGRENSFNPNVLFGSHIDPAANSGGGAIRNIGMLSWNGGRGKNIAGYLQSRGLLGSNGMVRNQDNLNAQAAFSVREMQSKAYRGGLQNFWNNPNANPETYSRELGKNYIAWAYGQNTIRAKGGGRVAFNWQEHDARRRNYLNTLGGMLGDKTRYAPMQPQRLGQFGSIDEALAAQKQSQPMGKFSSIDEALAAQRQAEPLGKYASIDEAIAAQQPKGQYGSIDEALSAQQPGQQMGQFSSIDEALKHLNGG